MKPAHRIFFSLSILLSSILTTASISTDQLKNWHTTYLNIMTQEELQFTANFLYLSYAVALVESKIRQFNTPILHLNQSIRLNIANNQTTTEDLATLKTLLERLSFVAGTRTIYIETYNTCQKQYEQYTTPTIQAALENIQESAQIKLRAWADKKISSTTDKLKQTHTDIGQSLQYLAAISNTYDDLSKGNLPIEVTPENEENRSLMLLNLILSSTPQLITITENLANTFNETSDDAAEIITAGAEIYKQYYSVIHYLMMSPTFDKQYAKTMFGMHDILPDEYKTMLPEVNSVFSHMLETTKLYTQAEVVQQ